MFEAGGRNRKLINQKCIEFSTENYVSMPYYFMIDQDQVVVEETKKRGLWKITSKIGVKTRDRFFCASLNNEMLEKAEISGPYIYQPSKEYIYPWFLMRPIEKYDEEYDRIYFKIYPSTMVLGPDAKVKYS